jgi:FRG domain-containing protein
MEIRYIKSFDDLGILVNEHFKEKWIFRGVDDERYGLRPKIGRDGARKDPQTGGNVPYSLSDERRMLDQFKREARPLVPFLPSLETEWLAVAQHHGMPTRLLDWTESPVVALYFAVKPSGFPAGAGGERRDAAIYGVEPPAHMHGTTVFSDFGPADPALLRPPHLSPRITAQRGVFTIHSRPNEDWQPMSLVKWIVPGDRCFTLKRMLDFCAINEASMFPDLVGLAQNLGFRYKWGTLD